MSEQLCIVYFVDTSFFCKEFNVIEVSYKKFSELTDITARKVPDGQPMR